MILSNVGNRVYQSRRIIFIAIIAMPSLWWVSGLLGLVASLSIELGQYLLLPHRFASPVDVAMNTAGALLGGAVVAGSRLWVGRKSARPL